MHNGNLDEFIVLQLLERYILLLDVPFKIENWHDATEEMSLLLGVKENLTESFFSSIF